MAVIDITAFLEAEALLDAPLQRNVKIASSLAADATLQAQLYPNIDVAVTLTSDATLSSVVSRTRDLTCTLSASADLTAPALSTVLTPPPVPPPIADVHVNFTGEYVMQNGSHEHQIEVTSFNLAMGTVLEGPFGARWRVERVAPSSSGQVVTLRPLAPTPYSLRPMGNLRIAPNP